MLLISNILNSEDMESFGLFLERSTRMVGNMY